MIKRYDPANLGFMYDCDDGDFVAYSDHLAIVNELKAQLNDAKLQTYSVEMQRRKDIEVLTAQKDALYKKIRMAVIALGFDDPYDPEVP